MDAHRTAQGTAAISATMRGLRGAVVTTSIRSCSHIKLLPLDKGQSIQELKPLDSCVSEQNSMCPACIASNDELIPGGVKLVKKEVLLRRGAVHSEIRYVPAVPAQPDWLATV